MFCLRVYIVRGCRSRDACGQIEKNDSELRQYRDIVVADDA